MEPPKEMYVPLGKLRLLYWSNNAYVSCRNTHELPEPNDDIYNAVKNHEYFRRYSEFRQALCIRELNSNSRGAVMVIEEFEDTNLVYIYKLD